MLIRIVLIALLGYVLYAVIVFSSQRQMLFPGQYFPPLEGIVDRYPQLERIRLQTSVGAVEAWFLPPWPEDPAIPYPAVIVAHGNGELIDYLPEQLSRFREWGLGLMLVEYPGYGRSEGFPSQATITETMVAAYDVLIRRNDIDPTRLIAYGRSVGGGAVCALARLRPLAGLILQSTFTSIRVFARGFALPGMLVRDSFDNLNTLAAYRGPVLILHGNRDDLIPYRHGVALAQAAKHSKLVTYDCVHNDCPPDWAIFWRDVRSFLRDHGILSAPGPL